jgi:hypothetical protein
VQLAVDFADGRLSRVAFEEVQMTGLVKFCAVAMTVAGFAALTSGTLRAEECKTFGSVGSGLSKSVATLMAKQGAINIAEARGYKAQGEAKLISCEDAGIFGTECRASVRGCKRRN